MLPVLGQRRVGEQLAQRPVLGHHDESLGLVVDDPDGVELEEPGRHHERGLARVRHLPVPAPRRREGVPAHPVVLVESSLGLPGGEHQLVGAEERQELLPVLAHVLPALDGLVLVAEHQVGVAGGQLDRQPGDLLRVRGRVGELVPGREPGRVVVVERQQGPGHEGPRGGRLRQREAVDAVAQVVDQVQRVNEAGAAGPRFAGAHLEHPVDRVVPPPGQQFPVRRGQVTARRQQPPGGPRPAGLGQGRAKGFAARDQVSEFRAHGRQPYTGQNGSLAHLSEDRPPQRRRRNSDPFGINIFCPINSAKRNIDMPIGGSYHPSTAYQCFQGERPS